MSNEKAVLKWGLIVCLTLVSTTLLMFTCAYIGIFDEAAMYFDVPKEKIVFLTYTFNIFYLAITPLLLPHLKKQFPKIIKISILAIAVGCLGRWLCYHNYSLALLFSIIVGISHIPIITAPYGILPLFPEHQQGYASSIPLFVPALGINFVILYSIGFILDPNIIWDLTAREANFQKLNLIIAGLAIFSTIGTWALLNCLHDEIRDIGLGSDARPTQRRQEAQVYSWHAMKSMFQDTRQYLVLLVSWGSILGLNWSYGGMFGIFLKYTDFSHKDIALLGLSANISSAVFSNFGVWLKNNFGFSNTTTIYMLNLTGFLSTLYILSSSIGISIGGIWGLMIAIVMLRAGFSSFVALALIELSSYGPGVLVSAMFFYVANAMNLGTAYLVTLTSNKISLAAMSILAWLLITIVRCIKKLDRKVARNEIRKGKEIREMEEVVSEIEAAEIEASE